MYKVKFSISKTFNCSEIYIRNSLILKLADIRYNLYNIFFHSLNFHECLIYLLSIHNKFKDLFLLQLLLAGFF